MPIPAQNQTELFVSDLLYSDSNAVTLNGLNSSAFLRTDVSSIPEVDNTISLGNPAHRFEDIYTTKINGINTDNIMYINKTNIPDVDAKLGTDAKGYDFGSNSFYWKNGYFRCLIVDKIQCPSITTGPNNKKMAHSSLEGSGEIKHSEIDQHIRATQYVHGATPENSAGTIVMRSANCEIKATKMYANIFEGTATRAKYADLAENYSTKEKNIEEGLVFSMSKDLDVDVELCNEELCNKVVGVVSKNPSYLMNIDCKNPVCIGIKGLVKILVKGSINKGDILVSTLNGRARVAKSKEEELYKIAFANESIVQNESDEALISCIL